MECSLEYEQDIEHISQFHVSRESSAVPVRTFGTSLCQIELEPGQPTQMFIRILTSILYNLPMKIIASTGGK